MMRKTLWALLLAVAASPTAFCGDEQFNGRWDIKATGQPRAWWLEVEGAGTPALKGKFISAFMGDLNVIEQISIANGQLHFGWTRTDRRQNGQPVTRKLEYTARLINGKLEGTFQVEGQTQPVVQWTGVRAPAIDERDDGTWRAGKAVELFNDKDLSGWISWDGTAPVGWSVKDGLLSSMGRGQDLLSVEKFWNFKLHAEFRLATKSNSGIGLRNRYEVQILDDYGRPPNAHSAGALYSRIPPSENASKPAGEWQTYDIRLIGREVTVVFNGKTVIDKGVIEGLTAIAHNADEAEPGGICLQGDHGPVEFRRLTITPLVK